MSTTNRIAAIAAVGMAIASLHAQPAQKGTSEIDRAIAVITPKLLKSHVRFLSHDVLRGRDTGDVGYEIAREYVSSQFVRIGLQPGDGTSYLQPFEVVLGGKERASSLTSGSVVLKSPDSDASFSPAWRPGAESLRTEGVYVGYGFVTPGRDDYAGLDVRGKIVFMLAATPPDAPDDHATTVNGRFRFETAAERGALAVVTLMTPGGRARAGGAAPTPELLAARQAQMADPAARQRRREGLGGAAPKALADGGGPTRPDVMIGPMGTRQLITAWGLTPATLETAKNVGPVTLERSHETRKVTSWNIVGLLPGSDPALKNEAVVVTAHLDHVGVGEPDETGDRIFNGAHDNSMGTAKMLAAAEALVRLRPGRTIVFASVGAEEGGVLGSWHYVRRPVIPLDRTALVINQDGGREGDPSEDVITFGNQFSTAIDRALVEATKAMGMRVSMDRRPPLAPSALFSSDHVPFMYAGVPGLYLMDGYTVAGDPDRGFKDWSDYSANARHRQSDNFSESWTFGSAARMAALTVRLAMTFASAKQMPQVNKDAPLRQTRGLPPGR